MSRRIAKSSTVVEVADGEPLEQRAFELERPQRMRVDSVRPLASCSVPSGSRAAIVVSSPVAVMRTGRPGLRSTGSQRVGAGRQPQRRPRARELDDERAAFDGA